MCMTLPSCYNYKSEVQRLVTCHINELNIIYNLYLCSGYIYQNFYNTNYNCLGDVH